MTKYKIEAQSYTSTIKIHSNCNAITFYNTGLIVAKINNIPLPVGESLSIEGNANEMDVTIYDIDLGTATTGTVFVIKKVNQ